MTGFALAVDDDLDLVLRDHTTVAPLHQLIVANQDRLSRWEPWARGEQTLEGLAAYTRTTLQRWVDGEAVPTAIRHRGELVGSLGAQIDGYQGVAAIGYWLDAQHEGRGLVSRAASALIEHLVTGHRIGRVEIRADVDNRRSRAVAERLGFTLEGVLRAAIALGDERRDQAVYGLVRGFG